MLSLGGYYILNKSLCVPVRQSVRTRTSSLYFVMHPGLQKMHQHHGNL